MRGLALAALCLALASCRGDTLIELPLPDDSVPEGTQSIILAIDGGDGRTDLWAYRAFEDAPGPDPIHEGAGGAAYFLTYPIALERLGLEPGGFLSEASAQDGGPVPLSYFEPSSVQFADFSEEPVGWTELDELPSSLQSVTLPLYCVDFEPRAAALPEGEHGIGAVDLGDSSALIMTADQKFFRYDYGGRLERLDELDGLPTGTSYRDRTGRIWLFGYNGRAARGSLESGFEELEPPEAPTNGRFLALHAEETEDALSIALVSVSSSTSTVVLRTEDEWRVIDPKLSVSHFNADIAHYGDEIVVALANLPGLQFYPLAGGPRRTERPQPQDAELEFATVTKIPDLGLVAAGRFPGPLYLRGADGDWAPLHPDAMDRPTEVKQEPRATRPFRSGFYAVGNRGVQYEYLPETGPCRPDQMTRLSPLTIDRLIAIPSAGAFLALTALPDIVGPAAAIWVTPRDGRGL